LSKAGGGGTRVSTQIYQEAGKIKLRTIDTRGYEKVMTQSSGSVSPSWRKLENTTGSRRTRKKEEGSLKKVKGTGKEGRKALKG